jgi:hypothetical protein
MAAAHATSGTERTPGGNDGGGWRALLRLTIPSLCWEFLRRNSAYRLHFEDLKRGGALETRWGLSAPADPDLSAEAARVVWRADAAPGLVVPLERRSFGAAKALPAVNGAPVDGADGRHLRLASGLQLQFRGDAAPDGPLMIVLSYDDDFNLRVRAVDALRRATQTNAPPRSRFSTEQRARLARSLFALDGSLQAQSYRDIAVGLFGDDNLDRDDFKTSSLRDVTIRLVRRGRSLMAGGYLKLLRAGF